MRYKVIGIVICLAALVGCASVRQVPSTSELPWHDVVFAYDTRLVSVTKEELFRLDPGRTTQSIDALEEAQLLTSGFEEVHRYLAVAYSRAGEQARASEQLGLLAALTDASGAGRARKKKSWLN